jgi:hypothetical protein
MSAALESMLSAFTARRGGAQAVRDIQGGLLLVLSQLPVVTLVEDAVIDEVRVLAHAGRLPCRLQHDDGTCRYVDQWLTFPHEQDGFEWATAYNPESGNVVLTARERLSDLDLVTFEAWLGTFLIRLKASSSAFTGGQSALA